MADRSKLVKMKVVNIGCIGSQGLEIALDNILCLVGPNNCGKSTVLRAYELAIGAERFTETDYNKWANNEPASVELWVHIPTGIGNIADKWKTPENGLLLVRSKWEWTRDTGWAKQRTTWDPENGEFSGDEKAAGFDPVFASKLPKPFRIGTLDNPEEEHKKLLTLVLQPLNNRLKAEIQDSESLINQARASLHAIASATVEEERAKLAGIRSQLADSHSKLFPELAVDFQIELGDVPFDPIDMLRRNSHIKFTEGETDVRWSQQGTGSQRALFWSLLQVRSKLDMMNEIAEGRKRTRSDLEKSIRSLEAKMIGLKRESTIAEKQIELADKKSQLAAIDERGLDQDVVDSNDIALPGYMLMIDEPEVALHPSAVRAAQQYLYELANDVSWQIMLTTHSPAFVNPLEDHTTIVRLERNERILSPTTYIAENSVFSLDDRECLKMLNRFDSALAEMFFGQFPILVEGDTEFTAFESVMNFYSADFPMRERPVLIRTRGKWTMKLIIQMLTHFKVNFAVLHDGDSPMTKSGKQKNSAWKANIDLIAAIDDARSRGLRIVHRVSVPNFEKFLFALKAEDGAIEFDDEPVSDKPWNVYHALRSDDGFRKKVRMLLDELMSSESRQEAFAGGFIEGLESATKAWAAETASGDLRYVFP